MALFDRFKFWRKSSDPLALWAEMLRAGRSSKAGPTINLDNALKVATLFACLRVLSQGVAQVPFKLFQEQLVDGLKRIEAARWHRHYDLVASLPNEWQTSFEFREQLVLHAGLGNAYAWKSRTIAGVSELILLDPGRMIVEQPSEYEKPVYKYSLRDGKTLIYAAEEIWHVRGPSWSGFAGLDVLQIARDALGLSIATEDSHASLHAKGVKPSGVYSVDGTLSEPQYKQIQTWLKKEAAENSGAPLILDRGGKWVSQSMSGIDAQHLETRKHQIEEVCRFMGVAPHKIYSTDKTSTYASAEQFSIQHVVDSLGPWFARIEQSADINLLTKNERTRGYYFKFNANGLLRGAAKDRADYYAKALGSGGHPGWMSPDEVRALEELNPMGGDAGKLPPGSAAAKKPPEEPEPAMA